MATLGLKEMRKFLWEGREKGLLPETANWANFFPYLPKGIFPFSSNLRYAQQSSLGKYKKKSGIMKSGLDAMPLFLLDDLLSKLLRKIHKVTKVGKQGQKSIITLHYGSMPNLTEFFNLNKTEIDGLFPRKSLLCSSTENFLFRQAQTSQKEFFDTHMKS